MKINYKNTLIKLLVLVVLLAIIACSEKKEQTYEVKNENGVKVIYNEDKGIAPHLEIKPELLFTIEADDEAEADTARGFTIMSDLDIDSKGNIYILDMNKSLIKKFSKDGKYLGAFGRRGQGPGELQLANVMAVIEDTVYAGDLPLRKFSKFSPSGEFASSFTVTHEMPQYLFKAGKDKFLSTGQYFENVDDENFLVRIVGIYNKWFELVHEVFKVKIKIQDNNDGFNLLDYIAVVTCDLKNERVFVAENSEDFYKVHCYDYSGNLLYTIKKDYMRIPFSENELDDFNRTTGRIYPRTTAKFKKAINEMFYDKYDRLWVCPSVDRTKGNPNRFVADIFKEGVFLKTIEFDFTNGYDYFNEDRQLFFQNGLIYLMNMGDATTEVYKY